MTLIESFNILEMTPTSNIDAVKAQYRVLAKKYHPDLHKDTGRRFNMISEAYQFILNNKSLINFNMNPGRTICPKCSGLGKVSVPRKGAFGVKHTIEVCPMCGGNRL